jgi:hypothetical protein
MIVISLHYITNILNILFIQEIFKEAVKFTQTFGLTKLRTLSWTVWFFLSQILKQVLLLTNTSLLAIKPFCATILIFLDCMCKVVKSAKTQNCVKAVFLWQKINYTCV